MLIRRATLERVQRKAARFCSKNYSPTTSVTNMIKDLEWESLENRRKNTRLGLLWKFSHNLIDVSTDKFLQLSTETRTRGSHLYKYRVQRTKKDVLKFSYFDPTKNYRMELTPLGSCMFRFPFLNSKPN